MRLKKNRDKEPRKTNLNQKYLYIMKQSTKSLNIRIRR